MIADEELLDVPPPEHTVRGAPARMTTNELIRSVGWEEDGVAYALEVECAAPEHDARCTEPDFLLELASQLVPAGDVLGGHVPGGHVRAGSVTEATR